VRTLIVIVDIQIFFFKIYKRNFLCEEHRLGLWVGQIIALPAKIQRWLIQQYLAYTSDNKLFYKLIYRFKRGFLWGMYRKRG